jgi:hypothetical protein
MAVPSQGVTRTCFPVFVSQGPEDFLVSPSGATVGATRRPRATSRHRPDTTLPGAWRSRIVGEGSEAPDQLVANPGNWRIHLKAQQDALSSVLDEVGWVQRVIVQPHHGARRRWSAARGAGRQPQRASGAGTNVELTPEEEATDDAANRQ